MHLDFMQHPGRWSAPILGMIAMMLTTGAVRAEEKPDKIFPEARTFTAGGATMPYLLLKPKDYDAGQKYPLVMFYHGAGERGDDGKKQWKNGVEVFAQARNMKKFPCFVVAPQCPLEKQWVNVPWAADSEAQPKEPSDELKLSLDILAAVRKEFSIDEKRLYVVGISMGGYATWDVTTRYPDLFAAAVPICGGGDEKAATKIKDLPIWAFHGGADTVVKPMRSRNMIAAIEQAGGKPKFTEYPGVGHGSWGPALHDPALMAWLFEQHKP